MFRCLLSLGANIGDALSTIRQAQEALASVLCQPGSIRVSRCFRTPPIGGPAGQPPFINAVAAIETKLDVWQVWQQIRRIEKELGRQRNQRWEARKIDLDILLYEHQTIWTPHLKVPHPRMCMRRFVLMPAADIADDWFDPVSQCTIGELAQNIRHHAGNLTIVAQHDSNPQTLLVDVANRARAEIRDGSDQAEKTDVRWIAKVTYDNLLTQLEQARLAKHELAKLQTAKLLCVLAPAVPVVDVAWEDYHRRLAQLLRLCERFDNSALQLIGPRYLLANDDRDWATQELVAALEAMDCPVEPISE